MARITSTGPAPDGVLRQTLGRPDPRREFGDSECAKCLADVARGRQPDPLMVPINVRGGNSAAAYAAALTAAAARTSSPDALRENPARPEALSPPAARLAVAWLGQRPLNASEKCRAGRKSRRNGMRSTMPSAACPRRMSASANITPGSSTARPGRVGW